MKNKLLVSVFATAIAAFAFTSCEQKSDVSGVFSDMIKETLHRSARGLTEFDEKTGGLTISEYEFLGGVNDNRIVYRTMAFGPKINEPKSVDTLTYEYGVWSENNTAYSLLLTPRTGDPYTLIYKGDAFIAPDGRSFGGDATAATARVEKWEKTIETFQNTDWEATYRAEFTLDSIFRDSIRTTFIPPMTFKKDTIKIFTGKMDTVSADTTCLYRYEFYRDPVTFANTGHAYRKSVRSEYDRETKQTKIVSENIIEFDFEWCFSDVTSDSRFQIRVNSLKPGVVGPIMNISKYKIDDTGTAVEFLQNGLTFTRPVKP